MRYLDLLEREYPTMSDLAADRLCPFDMFVAAKPLCENIGTVTKEFCRRCWEQEAKE